MCISLVFCIKPDHGIEHQKISGLVEEKIKDYGYSCRSGIVNLKEAVQRIIEVELPGYLAFELHDPREPHCACDIDHDIRIKSKLGEESDFFRLVKEVKELKGILGYSILFADNDSIEGEKLRMDSGGFGDFFDRLNNWYTWQVEGFEPTRKAYYIAENSPYLYKFVNELEKLTRN